MSAFRLTVPVGLLLAYLPALASDEPVDNTMSIGVNCTFKAEPDRVLAAASRARQSVLNQLQRIRPRASAEPGAVPNLVPAGSVPVKNFVDEAIFGTLTARNVPAAQLTSDEEFLRRIYLDLTGRIPPAAKVREFTANTAANKRDIVIDELLYSPQFTDRWVLWLGDLMGNAASNSYFSLQNQGRNAFYSWMWKNVDNGMSIKDLAWNVITAKGNNFEVGPANYVLRNSTPGGPVQDTYDTAAVRATRDFLGIGHYDCIMCHNGRAHLDAVSLWGKSATRQEALNLSAFFSRQRNVAVTADRTDPAINARIVSDAVTGQYDLNTTFGNRPNRTPYGTARSLTPIYRNGATPKGVDWRGEFAELMINDPLFSVNFANRIWKQLFNLALAEPVDQLDPLRLDPDNPPASPWTLQASHPALLQRLAQEMRARDFNLREFIRVLVSSNAYQLSSRWDGNYSVEHLNLFGRHYPRRLEGEEIHDAIVQATGMMPSYTVPGFDGPVQWALRLPEPTLPAASWMNNFLRGNRNTTERMQSASIQQQLSLMNDTFITGRTKVAASPMLRAIAAKTAPADIIDDLWLTFLSRRPSAAESERATGLLARANTAALKNAAIEDLAWALINKLDFIFSY